MTISSRDECGSCGGGGGGAPGVTNPLSGDLNANGYRIFNLGTPTQDSDAARLLDILSLPFKKPARLAAATTLASYDAVTTPGDLEASVNGALGNLDGVAPQLNDRVLVWLETGGNKRYNGVYTVIALGSGSSKWRLRRATDMNTSAKVPPGTYVFVSEGSTLGNHRFNLFTDDPIVLGTTDLDFQDVTASGGGISNPLTADLDADNAYQVINLVAPATESSAYRLLDAYRRHEKQPCRLATAANLASFTGLAQTLTATVNGALCLDGSAVALNDRVLVTRHGQYNGIYIVTATGSVDAPWVLTRSADANDITKLYAGVHVYVSEGAVNQERTWTLRNAITTMGTTVQLWTDLGPDRTVTSSMGVRATGFGTDPIEVWQGDLSPSEWLNKSTYRLRVALKTTSSRTTYFRMRNLTTSTDVEIGGPGITTLSTTNSSDPMSVLDTVNLLNGVVGFNATTSQVYALYFYGSTGDCISHIGSIQQKVSL